MPNANEFCYDLEINSPLSICYEDEITGPSVSELELLVGRISKSPPSLYTQDMLMEVFDKLALGKRINSFRYLLQDTTDDDDPHQKIMNLISDDSKFPKLGPGDPKLR